MINKEMESILKSGNMYIKAKKIKSDFEEKIVKLPEEQGDKFFLLCRMTIKEMKKELEKSNEEISDKTVSILVSFLSFLEMEEIIKIN